MANSVSFPVGLTASSLTYTDHKCTHLRYCWWVKYLELGNHHHYPIQHHFIYPPSKPGHITATLSLPTTPLRLPGNGSSLSCLWDLLPLPVQFLNQWLPNFPGVAMLPRGCHHALQGRWFSWGPQSWKGADSRACLQCCVCATPRASPWTRAPSLTRTSWQRPFVPVAPMVKSVSWHQSPASSIGHMLMGVATFLPQPVLGLTYPLQIPQLGSYPDVLGCF